MFIKDIMLVTSEGLQIGNKHIAVLNNEVYMLTDYDFKTLMSRWLKDTKKPFKRIYSQKIAQKEHEKDCEFIRGVGLLVGIADVIVRDD